MLNGNKSYLISFTALFNKKGYELAIGIDTIFDDVRDTQYHLTAPAISTYRTLKMDVMKTATKSPYSASSLFGKGLREAANATEFEAVEIQTVYANVVSYLSDIQRHFSGESRVDGARLEAAKGERAEVEAESGGQSDAELYHKPVRLDTTVQAENVVEAYHEATEVAENIIRAEAEEFVLSENIKKIEIHGLSDSVIVSDVYDAAVQQFTDGDVNFIYNTLLLEFTGAENIKPALNANLEAFSDSFIVSPIADVLEQTLADNVMQTEVEHFADTRLTTDTKDAYVLSSTDSVRDDELDLAPIEKAIEGGYINPLAHIQGFKGVGKTNDWENADIEPFTASDNGYGIIGDVESFAGSFGLTDVFDSLIAEASDSSLEYNNDGEIVHFFSGQTQDGGEVIIEHMTGSANQSGNELTEPLEVVRAINDPQQVESTNEESLTAEMIKGIVTGSPEVSQMARLMEIMYGQKAMELVYAGMDGIIQETMIQETIRADSGSITDAVIAKMSEVLNGGIVEGTGDCGTSKGTVEYFGNAAEVKPEHGTVGSYEEADNSIRPEYGTVDITGEAVEDKPEHGTFDRSGEGVLAEPEHGRVDSFAEGVYTKPEHGLVDSYGEGFYTKPEHGSVVTLGDGVRSSEPDFGTVTTFGDGVYQFIEVGERNMERDGVIHDIGKAIVEANKKLVTVDAPEQGEVVTFGEGVLDQPEHGMTDSRVDVELTVPEHGGLFIVPESDFAKATETGVRDMSFGSIEAEPETAVYGKGLEAFDAKSEHANNIGQNIEGVEHFTEYADKYGETYEGVYEVPALAGREDVAKEAVVHAIEGGAKDDAAATVVADNNWAVNNSFGEAVIDHETELGSADLTLDAVQSTGEGGTGELVYDVVNNAGVAAYIGDIYRVVDNQEQVQGQLNGGTVESEIGGDTQAESVLVTEGADVGEITDSIRKKKVIPTDVIDSVDSLRKKKVIETDITEIIDSQRKKKVVETKAEGGEQATRVKEVVNVNVEEPNAAVRPKKVIETEIVKPSEATHKTPPISKKESIWLIMGKIASWSIWNWKKTR